MATTILVDVSDIVQLGRQMDAAAPVIAQESRIAMERSALTVQSAAKHRLQQEKAIDTGRLLNSITYARPVQPFQARIGTNLKYGPNVEYGRQAGAPMPPAGSLLGWLQRHGIAASLEFVIRRAIRRRGIRKRPYLVPALETSRSFIDREFDAALLRAAKFITARRTR